MVTTRRGALTMPSGDPEDEGGEGAPAAEGAGGAEAEIIGGSSSEEEDGEGEEGGQRGRGEDSEGSDSDEEYESDSDDDDQPYWHGADDEDDEGEYSLLRNIPRVPDEVPPLEGDLAQEILRGSCATPVRGLRRPGDVPLRSPMNALQMLRRRESALGGGSRAGGFSHAECCHMAGRYLPVHTPTVVDSMNSRAYIGQFSPCGDFFVGAFQDKRVRIYDVANQWRVKKDVICRMLRWTVTDTAISPDNRFLVYSSITPIVHLVNVGSESGGVESLANVTDIHEGLHFGAGAGGRHREQFGLWSIKFSADGRELVGGSSDQSLYVYDVEANKPVLRARGHSDDVNAVAFADESSNVIYSGSDDSLIKVWDRRCLTSRAKPAGVLVGHTQGVTCISSKGDGRYLISNSKDQTLKLWDTRKMISWEEERALPRGGVPEFHWDYRWMNYPATGYDLRHPHDSSIMTYRGHEVLQTLIRCYFSPAHSTGQRFVYSGSKCGKVFIWDLITAKVVETLDLHNQTVRDCSWHPYSPMMATVSWDGMVCRWDHHRDEEQARSPTGLDMGDKLEMW